MHACRQFECETRNFQSARRPFAVRGPHSAAAVSEPFSVSMTGELDRMCREFAPLVYRIAWGVLGSREDADDVVRSVFIGLFAASFFQTGRVEGSRLHGRVV